MDDRNPGSELNADPGAQLEVLHEANAHPPLPLEQVRHTPLYAPQNHPQEHTSNHLTTSSHASSPTDNLYKSPTPRSHPYVFTFSITRANPSVQKRASSATS